MAYHSHEFFGLSRTDSIELYCRQSGWRPPDKRALRRNASAINRLRRNINSGQSMNDGNETAELEPVDDDNNDNDNYHDNDNDNDNDNTNSVHSDNGNL